MNSSCAFEFSLSHSLTHIGGTNLREACENDVTAKQCNMSPNFQEVGLVSSVRQGYIDPLCYRPETGSMSRDYLDG